MPGIYIGVDIGGSGIDAGLFSEDGALVERGRAPVSDNMPPERIVRELTGLLETLVTRAGVPGGGVAGIGVGIPGTFDADSGRILYTANLPLGGTDIVSPLMKRFGAPVFLENDANCAALGEKRAPGREAVRDMVFVTLGTGVGGGIIAGGAIYSGMCSAAGEIGHMVIVQGGRPCACGRRGCWERYASASALAEDAARLALDARGGAILRLCDGDVSRVTAKTPFDAARAGDAASTALVGEYIEYLACGMTNLVNIFQPQLLCVGGGVSREPDEWLLDPLREAIYRDMYPHGGGARVRVEKSVLGSDAGITGAAALCGR